MDLWRWKIIHTDFKCMQRIIAAASILDWIKFICNIFSRWKINDVEFPKYSSLIKLRRIVLRIWLNWLAHAVQTNIFAIIFGPLETRIQFKNWAKNKSIATVLSFIVWFRDLISFNVAIFTGNFALKYDSHKNKN